MSCFELVTKREYNRIVLLQACGKARGDSRSNASKLSQGDSGLALESCWSVTHRLEGRQTACRSCHARENCVSAICVAVTVCVARSLHSALDPRRAASALKVVASSGKGTDFVRIASTPMQEVSHRRRSLWGSESFARARDDLRNTLASCCLRHRQRLQVV